MLKFLKRLKKVLQPVELLKRKKEDPQKSTDEIDFEGFQKAINYKVLNKNYFINALAHRSYLKIKKNSIGTLTSNERLEFLGDAVIDLIVAEYLYKNFPFNEEGDLTKFRSILVNKKFLAERAKEINIQSYLLASFSALKSIEEGYYTILADAYEAIVGAIFLDSGYDSAKEFLNNEIFKKLDIKWLNHFDDNFKSRLLEFAQANTNFVPIYRVIKEEGLEHNKLFTVEVYINNVSLGIGKGKSKKQSEQEAAKNALSNLDILEKAAAKKSKTSKAKH